jgi:hypothetical protein
MKCTKDSREAITAAASGDGFRALGMRGMSSGAVVKWNADGSCTGPGPEASHCEAAKAECEAHLLFNAFWSVSHCCIHALFMRDSMHQIDLGVIIRLIMAIQRKYWECVLQFLGEDNEGLAKKKLEARFCKVLDRRTGQDGQSQVI